MQTAPNTERHPWLDSLIATPDSALDAVLRGVAHLPGLQRASPCEALMALMGDLPEEAPEWPVLDHALLVWLKRRRSGADEPTPRRGGMRRFVYESGEAFRAAWRLGLPESGAWVSAELLDLLRWADGFELDEAFDLGNAVLAAGAHLQSEKNRELRFLWLRVAEAAAGQRLRHRLDTAMLGLARGNVGAPVQDLIVGLTRWASRLPKDEQNKGVVKREWFAIKAGFPRTPGFWRGQWEAILDDPRHEGHPFTDWLKDADPCLRKPTKGKVARRAPELPKNIKGTIAEMEKRLAKEGLSDPLWRDMKDLLNKLEVYTEVSGETYYLVTSCVNIANILLEQAPGYSLTLTRRAQLWSPRDAHSWSVRAKALDRLGHPDLAKAVRWEGSRRIPSHEAFRVDLALGCLNDERPREAESLLRKAMAADPKHAISHHTLACLCIAEGRIAEASDLIEEYGDRFGKNQHHALLSRLLAAGETGRQEKREHFRKPRDRAHTVHAVPGDAPFAEAALAAEMATAGRLRRISAVAEADLLFQNGGSARDEAMRRIDEVLALDDSDSYAQLVKTLADEEHRQSLEGRSGRFGSLPLQLAMLPPEAPPIRWNRLREAHPDERPLIDLVRFARAGAKAELDETRDVLMEWSKSPSGWDDGWGEFLKKNVARHLRGEAASAPDLSGLVHDALTQAVDVGWDAVPLVA